MSLRFFIATIFLAGVVALSGCDNSTASPQPNNETTSQSSAARSADAKTRCLYPYIPIKRDVKANTITLNIDYPSTKTITSYVVYLEYNGQRVFVGSLHTSSKTASITINCSAVIPPAFYANLGRSTFEVYPCTTEGIDYPILFKMNPERGSYLRSNGPNAFNCENIPEGLLPGEYLISPNRRYVLHMGPNGNLALYDEQAGGRVLWKTQNVARDHSRLIMEVNGNLVSYQWNGANWHSNSSGATNAVLSLQDDGQLLILDNGFSNDPPILIWSRILPFGIGKGKILTPG